MLLWGPAGDEMVSLLNSRIVDRGSSLKPVGLNSRWEPVCAYPKSKEENGEGIVAWQFALGGDFTLSISLSLSFW